MEAAPPYPLLFAPVYKDYLWGGTRIPRRYGRAPRPGLCAESWEVADRPEGMSVVTNGAWRGRALGDLARTLGPRLAGAAAPAGPFPLLVKLIDARERLSLQVHPNDRTAAAVGGEPKTEMWYVLDAAPGARVFAGLAAGVTRGPFKEALRRGTVEHALTVVPAKPGTAIFIPGGRVHAIGAGCLLLEVQQNSNTTYRVYDWGRLDPASGRPRDLHVEQALACIDWDDRGGGAQRPAPRGEAGANAHFDVLDTPWFRIDRLELGAPEPVTVDPASCQILFVERGEVRIAGGGTTVPAPAGTTCLIPAALGSYTLLPASTPAAVIRTMPGAGCPAADHSS